MRITRLIPWLRSAAGDAGAVLRDVRSLIRAEWLSTLALGLGFSALPALWVFFSDLKLNSLMYSAWEFIISGVLGRLSMAEAMALYQTKLVEASTASYYLGSNSWFLSLLISVALTPILQGALALIYHGRLEKNSCPMERAVRKSASVWTRLVVVALTSYFASRFILSLSSIISGLISAIVNIFTAIPYIGPILIVLVTLLALAIDAVATFAVSVLLCYIWQVTVCEGAGGFGALMKSIVFTRTDMKRTAVSLGALTLMRWGIMVVLGIVWLILFAARGTRLELLMGASQIISALFLTLYAATAAVLYARHPMRGSGGHTAPKAPWHLKSANIPGDSGHTEE